MLDNAEFIKSIKGSRFVTGESVRPSTVKDRAADRGLGLARRINIPTNKREFNTDKPLVTPAPTNRAVSSKGSVPVNPKAVMQERNQAQIDALQKKEYLKTYLKDKGTGTTSKPETVTRAKYKISSERREVPVDRPIVNLDGTVTTRTEPKTKREKPLTQEEKLEKARLAGQVAGTKRTAAQQTFEEEFPKESKPTGADKARFDAEKKAEAERLRREDLYEKYGGSSSQEGFRVPYVTPAIDAFRDRVVNPVARGLIGRDMNKDEVRGTLAGLTLAPIAVGTSIYSDHKRKKEEEEKLAAIEARRQAILDRRDAIIRERQNTLEQEMAKYNRKPDSIYATFLNFYEKAVAEFQDPATIQRLIQHGSTYIPQDNNGVVSLEKTLRGKMQKKKLREPKVPASMGVKEINMMIESGKPVGKYFNKPIRKSAEFNSVLSPDIVKDIIDGEEYNHQQRIASLDPVKNAKQIKQSEQIRDYNIGFIRRQYSGKSEFSAVGGALIGGGIGRLAGLGAGIARGAGVGETEEEKAKTGVGLRAAKVLGYGLLGRIGGGLAGEGVGASVGLGVGAIKNRYSRPQASFGLLDGTTRLLNKGKNAAKNIHERTKNPDWDAVNAANIGRVAGATAGAVEGSGLGESQEEREKTGLITRAAKVVGLAGVGGSLGAHAGGAVDLGRERLRYANTGRIELSKTIRKSASFNNSSAMVVSPAPDPTKSANPKTKLPLKGVVGAGVALGGGLLLANSLLKKKKKEEENA
jgi:hypothetical protein